MFTKITIVLLSSFLLLGCSGDSGQKQTAAKNDVIEVTFWHAMGGPLGKVLDDLIIKFNAQHPKINVTGVGMGNYPALNQKLMAAIAAGQPPTMAQAYESWTSQFQESGALTSMSHFISGPNGMDEESFNDLLDVFVEGNTFSGEMWSFPFNKSVRALYYNKTMFAANGLAGPPQTWDDYYNFAEKLTRDIDGDGNIDQYGTASQISAWMFGNLLLQNGGSLMNEDMTEVAYHSDLGVETLDFMVKLLGKDSKVGHITSGFDYQNEFLAGSVGMIEGSTVTSAYISGKYDFELGMAPIPSHKQKACIISGTNIVIFAKAPEEQQKAAWEFIKWFTSPNVTAEWASRTGYVPVRQSAFETDIMKTHFQTVPDMENVYKQLDYAYYEPSVAVWYAGRKYLEQNAIQSALKGSADPRTALEQAAQDTKAEIERMGL